MLQKTLKAYQEELGIKSMEDTRDYNEDDCIATKVIKDWLMSVT